MSPVSIVTYKGSQHLKLADCTTKYDIFLNEIEGKIAEFDKIRQAEICEKCKEIKEFIHEKNNKLKECYNSGVLPIELNDENTIKVFNRKCHGKTQCSKDSSPAFRESAKLVQKEEEIERDIKHNEQPQLQLKAQQDKASEYHKNPSDIENFEPTADSKGTQGTESDRVAVLSPLSDQRCQHLKDASCLNDSETKSTFHYISDLPLENITDNALHIFNESKKYASFDKQEYDKNNYYVYSDSNATNNSYGDVFIFTLGDIRNQVHKSQNEAQDTSGKEADCINDPSQRTSNTDSTSLQCSQKQIFPEPLELPKEHSAGLQNSTSQNLRDQVSQILTGESTTEGNSDNEKQQEHQAGLGNSTALFNEGSHDSNQDNAERALRSNESISLTTGPNLEKTYIPEEFSESDIFNIILGGIPLQKYIFPALAILGAIALFSLLLKYTYLGALFSKKKKKRRKEIEAEWQNILYGAPYVGQRNNYISYGGMEYE